MDKFHNVKNVNVDRIKEVAKSQGITMKYLCDCIGKYRTFLAAVRLGKDHIDENELSIIADKLNTTVEYLTGQTDDPAKPALPAGLEIYPVQSVTMVPVVGSVRAGPGGLAVMEYEGMEPVYDRRDTSETFWLRVKGDSMTPFFFENDLVLIHKQPDADSGDYVIALVDEEEGTLKKLQKLDGGGIALLSNNPAYEPRIFVGKALHRVQILGVVLESKRKF